ncbi:bile acid:sodium symporter family protein [Virgibacillus kimchii]
MKILNTISGLAGKYFAVLVIIIAVIAFITPNQFLWLNSYVTILLGIVMFGMGLTLKAVDFKLILTKPLPVFVGVAAQFVIMPLIAFVIAYLLNLPPAIAAGLVLLGSVPGGTASNVMVYLARGDVALSITMTSLSTLLAPIATPFILLLLAGQWLPVDPISMLLSIVQVIIVPIVLGLLVKRFFPLAVERSISAIPLISVTAIIIIVAAVVSANVDNIATSGLLVFAAVMLHNGFGLALGYLTAYFMKLDVSKQRAISLEVGMQNSGLGVSLATVHFEPLAALPSAAGAVWHNITGPILATLWAKKDAKIHAAENAQSADGELKVSGK